MSKNIKISLVKSLSGQYQIVDDNDEGAPLLTFHNEFNNEVFAEKIFDAMFVRSRQEIKEKIKQLQVDISKISPPDETVMCFVKYGYERTIKLLEWFIKKEGGGQ